MPKLNINSSKCLMLFKSVKESIYWVQNQLNRLK